MTPEAASERIYVCPKCGTRVWMGDDPERATEPGECWSCGCMVDDGDPQAKAVPVVPADRERALVELIREAGVTGQWGDALDWIRTGLVEPLEAENRALVEALREIQRAAPLEPHAWTGRDAIRFREIARAALSAQEPSE